MLNILDTLKNNDVTTVRDLVTKHKVLHLKKGLISEGHAKNFVELTGMIDEIIAWDDLGHVVKVPVRGGVWFEEVTLRDPKIPNVGTIVASLNETVRIQHSPLVVQRSKFGFMVDVVENDFLHFYRSSHPDAAPFFSISPMWLAVLEFHDLLARFPHGDYSDLSTITEVRNERAGLVAPVVGEFKA